MAQCVPSSPGSGTRKQLPAGENFGHRRRFDALSKTQGDKPIFQAAIHFHPAVRDTYFCSWSTSRIILNETGPLLPGFH